jgi:riboflavin synthase
MFTGIIKHIATIERLLHHDGILDLVIATPLAATLGVDESVAVDGVCLTVVEIAADGRWFRVQAVRETLSKTTLGAFRTGDAVHVEPALRVGDGLGGHMVQGHVDTTGTVREVRADEENRDVWVQVPEAFSDQLVPRGSITVDGVSLTMARVEDGAAGPAFMVTLIPYTWEHTTLGALKAGDAVNLEFDVIGKYVARYLELRQR